MECRAHDSRFPLRAPRFWATLPGAGEQRGGSGLLAAAIWLDDRRKVATGCARCCRTGTLGAYVSPTMSVWKIALHDDITGEPCRAAIQTPSVLPVDATYVRTRP